MDAQSQYHLTLLVLLTIVFFVTLFYYFQFFALGDGICLWTKMALNYI